MDIHFNKKNWLNLVIKQHFSFYKIQTTTKGGHVSHLNNTSSFINMLILLKYCKVCQNFNIFKV